MRPFDIFGIDRCEFCMMNDTAIKCKVKKDSTRIFDLPCSRFDQQKCSLARDKALTSGVK